jgi:hypothetical protein
MNSATSNKRAKLSASARIYFTDFFGTSPEVLENFGAFNISLVNDLPLFIDPFLLFDSDRAIYTRLHDDIIRYVKFLRDRSAESVIPSTMIREWFYFPEVKQNWLGFSRQGNSGSGLGHDFATVLHGNLHRVFYNFGSETISQGSHLEKLCLLGNGVGRDHLSDFTTNLIKGFLLDYTQTFARTHLALKERRTFAIQKVKFDYESQRWIGGRYELPHWEHDYILLTPKELLTKDEVWINRADLLDRFQDIYNSIPDDQLRARVNEHFRHQLSEDSREKEAREAAATTIRAFPELLDHYIRMKEDTGDQAHKISELKVKETEEQFIRQVRILVDAYLAGTEFYTLGDSFEASLHRVHFLKKVIENNDGYRLFYMNGKPVQREVDLQIMYRLTWFASPFEVDREVNNGRGPVDFKVSRGNKDKTLVEFKLASNTKLKKNLAHQVEVYEAANDTSKSIKVILHFNDSEYKRVTEILKELGLAGRRDVILIDASADNKPSASNA